MSSNPSWHLNQEQELLINEFALNDNENTIVLVAPPGSGKSVTIVMSLGHLFSTDVSRKVLVILESRVVVDHFIQLLKATLPEKDIHNIYYLNIQTYREMQSLRDNEPFGDKSRLIVITTKDMVIRTKGLQLLESIMWNEVIAELGQNIGKFHLDVSINYLLKIAARKKLLLFTDLSRKEYSSIFGSMQNVKYLKWRDDITQRMQNPSQEISFKIMEYDRTLEEIEFLKKYNELSNNLPKDSLGKQLRLGLASSSLFAAEKALYAARNNYVHGNTLSLFDSSDQETATIDSDYEHVELPENNETDKSLSEKVRLINETFELLDNILIDSKFNALITSLDKKGRIFIYSPYAATISYLAKSLQETLPDVHSLDMSITWEQVQKIFLDYSERGGILVGSTRLITGVNLPIDQLIFYDVPQNEALLKQMIAMLVVQPLQISSSDKSDYPKKSIYSFRDLSNVLPSERQRLRRLEKFLHRTGE